MGGASIIGIVNQKGGTGKTTSCVNLGVDLAREGKRVLLVDCDPQGSLTISLGHPQPDTLPATLADQMTAVLSDSPIEPGGILHHDEGVDLLPANIREAFCIMTKAWIFFRPIFHWPAWRCLWSMP